MIQGGYTYCSNNKLYALGTSSRIHHCDFDGGGGGGGGLCCGITKTGCPRASTLTGTIIIGWP